MKLGSHVTEEQRAGYVTRSMGNTYALGHRLSDEVKAKIGAASAGHITTPETRARLSASGIGHAVSPETRAKISAAKMGVPCKSPTLETRAKLSAIFKGSNSPRWKGGKQICRGKRKAKRRTLGFNPLNSWFVGCDAHHINPQDVIHLPHKLHKSVWHNQYTGKGMDKMNALAGKFLTEDWT